MQQVVSSENPNRKNDILRQCFTKIANYHYGHYQIQAKLSVFENIIYKYDNKWPQRTVRCRCCWHQMFQWSAFAFPLRQKGGCMHQVVRKTNESLVWFPKHRHHHKLYTRIWLDSLTSQQHVSHFWFMAQTRGSWAVSFLQAINMLTKLTCLTLSRKCLLNGRIIDLLSSWLGSAQVSFSTGSIRSCENDVLESDNRLFVIFRILRLKSNNSSQQSLSKKRCVAGMAKTRSSIL